MFNFGDSLPVEPAGLTEDVEGRLGRTVEDDVEPVVFPQTPRGVVFVGSQRHLAGVGAAFDLDKPHVNGGLGTFRVWLAGNQVKPPVEGFDTFNDAPFGFFMGDHKLNGEELNLGTRNHGGD